MNHTCLVLSASCMGTDTFVCKEGTSSNCTEYVNSHHKKVRHPGDLAHGIFTLLCNMNPKYKLLFEIWNYIILGTYMQHGEL